MIGSSDWPAGLGVIIREGMAARKPGLKESNMFAAAIVSLASDDILSRPIVSAGILRIEASAK